MRLGITPFTQQRTEYGISLDNPPYRQQRILYPLLGWLLAAGAPGIVPAVLVTINFVGVCTLAWIGARLAQSFGRRPTWGLVLPLYPGLIVSLTRDLTEIVAICCLAAALLVLMQQRYVVASLLFCGAVLSRETSVLMIACFLVLTVPSLARRLRVTPAPWYVAGVPLLVEVLWQAFLGIRWGEVPIASGGANLALPFTGILAFAAAAGPPPFSVAAWVRVIEVAGGVVMASAVLLALPKTRAPKPAQMAWVGYGLLALILSYAVWQSDWHALRALVEWHLLGVLILMASPSRLAMLPVLGSLPISVLTFLAAPLS